jgi:histidinol-phosphate phosphatase family protein
MVEKRLICFDRDGTLNKRNLEGYILARTELVLPHDIESLRLIKADYFAIVTNQACISKELISKENVLKINKAFNNYLSGGKVFKSFICPHIPSDLCNCRKPKCGLILEAMNFFSVNNFETLFIGDSISDKDAAFEAGVEFWPVCWDGECKLPFCRHSLTNVVDELNRTM